MLSEVLSIVNTGKTRCLCQKYKVLQKEKFINFMKEFKYRNTKYRKPFFESDSIIFTTKLTFHQIIFLIDESKYSINDD